MRKISLSLCMCLIAFSAFAQKKAVREAQSLVKDGELDKALEQINLALENPETSSDPKTFYVKGTVLQAIGSSKDARFAKLVENPLVKAFEAYQKAIEIDPKKKIYKDVDLQLITLSNAMVNSGVEAFNAKDYASSLINFEASLEVNKMPIFKNTIDTAVMFNAGLAATNSANWDKAIKFYNETKNYGYGGSNVYVLLKNAYIAKGDSVNGEAALKEGFSKNGKDLGIMVELINYYLMSNQSKAALEYLALAKQNDPNNPSFYFAEGSLYEKIGDTDKAFTAYSSAIEKDPKYFNGYYNIGVLFYNKAVKIFGQADNTKDNKEYERLKLAANEELKKSIPWMEKAHGIDPVEPSTMETLKNLYFRMQVIDAANEASWKEKFAAIKAEIDAQKK